MDREEWVLDGDGKDDEDEERLLNEESEESGDKLGSALKREGEDEGERLESDDNVETLLRDAEDA